jgi:hypothetical protein
MIHQKRLKNVEYIKDFGIIIRNNARYTSDVESGMPMAKAALHKNKTSSTSTLYLIYGNPIKVQGGLNMTGTICV